MVRIAPGILFAVFLTSAAATQGELVITREGDDEYHRPGCTAINDGKNVLAMQRGQAEARGLKPHKACEPSQAPRPGTAVQKPIYVFVDEGGKFYHREKCSKLGNPSSRMTVDDAVAKKKRWPCAACKPPIRPRPKKDDASTVGRWPVPRPAGDLP